MHELKSDFFCHINFVFFLSVINQNQKSVNDCAVLSCALQNLLLMQTLKKACAM